VYCAELPLPHEEGGAEHDEDEDEEDVHPSLGIPRLLSSNRLPGASGSRDSRRPPPPRPSLRPPPRSLAGFDGGGSAYLPSTRAARFGGSLGATPLALANCCGGWPLPGVTGNLSALGT
jgi:hypothetical protein